MSPINHELQLASDFVQYTGCNIFLTGKAGTGKTTFLHNLHKNTAKRMIITAPTGVAAINAGGVTLHSFFQLPFGPFVPGSDTYERNKQRQFRFSKEKNRQIFYKFYGFSTRRHLALFFEAFWVKSASHQQTLLRNAANSALRFGSRCFILIVFRHSR